QALYSNTGSGNTAAGYRSLYNNTTGYFNTAIGDQSMINNTTGNYNVALGSNAGPSSNNLSYTVALGAGSTATASYEDVFGTPTTTVITGPVHWSNISDGRFKKNISENVPGLEFIDLLRPVTYTIDVTGIDNYIHSAGSSGRNHSFTAEEIVAVKEKENIVYSGFIAQEVEQAAKQINYDFSGLAKPQNGQDIYKLSYDDFIPSLIVSVKQLNDSDKKTTNVLTDLQNQIDSIQKEIDGLKNANLAVSDAPALYQNKPNPFNSSTIISYYIPAKTKSAQLKIMNISGKTVKLFSIQNTGPGEVTFNSVSLGSEMYFYSLIIDGKTVITKKMILEK
ncbi:MAG TPA: tail fiber domain-containing protein, partial [Puia sp.]|nr:tail fiber domain-containing protein [Puia sp.]